MELYGLPPSFHPRRLSLLEMMLNSTGPYGTLNWHAHCQFVIGSVEYDLMPNLPQ